MRAWVGMRLPEAGVDKAKADVFRMVEVWLWRKYQVGYNLCNPTIPFSRLGRGRCRVPGESAEGEERSAIKFGNYVPID